MLGVAGVAGWAGWRKHVRGELNGQVAGCIVGGVALVWGIDWCLGKVLCKKTEERENEKGRGRK